MLPDTPNRICLCGSTRFKDEYIKATRELTLQGNIVISVGLFGHQEGIDMEGETKKMLDELHLRKIDICHEVFIINPLRHACPNCKTMYGKGVYLPNCSCGVPMLSIPFQPYIGESTKREIEYAKSQGKKITYLNEVK